MLSFCNFLEFFIFFNNVLSLLFWCLTTCKSGLAFNESLSSHFGIWQSTSNQGLWQCLFLELPPKGLLTKLDSTVAPTHYYNRSANPFAPRCLIGSTTHRFRRFVIKANKYSLAFDLSYLNVGKNFFVTTLCCGLIKLQSMLNCKCNNLWSKSAPIM